MNVYLIKHEDEILALMFADKEDNLLDIYIEGNDNINPEMADEDEDRIFRQERMNRMYVEEADFPLIYVQGDE